MSNSPLLLSAEELLGRVVQLGGSRETKETVHYQCVFKLRNSSSQYVVDAESLQGYKL